MTYLLMLLLLLSPKQKKNGASDTVCRDLDTHGQRTLGFFEKILHRLVAVRE